MSAFLGTLGRLIPIYSSPSMGVSGIPERTFQTTLEGRLKAQIKPVGRRSWDLSAAYASPGELAALMDFATGVWGNGPFVWVSPTAPSINLLLPEVASCGPAAAVGAAVSVAGPLLLPDGSWAGRSLSNPYPSPTLPFGPDTTPVIPGGEVTGSAYVVGVGAKVGVQFFNAVGAVISQGLSPLSGAAGVVTRLSVTLAVPALAVACGVYATATTQAARPALTWTDSMLEWGAGEGCDKAIVDAVSRDALTGSTDIRGRRDSNISFTIREVG